MPYPRNRTMKLSHKKIDALPPTPADHNSPSIEYTAGQEPGLKIVVFKQKQNKDCAVRKKWRLRYTFNGRKCGHDIGDYPAITLDEAIEIARAMKAMLAHGVDPKQAKLDKLNVATLQQFSDEIFEPRAKKERKGYKDVKSRLQNHVLPAFGDRPLNQISKVDVVRWHQQLADDISPITANRSLALLSAMLRDGGELELIDKNVCQGIRKAKEGGSRSRVMTSEEFSRFVAALLKIIDKPQGAAIFLLLALGLRKMEILSLRWVNVDLDGNCIYIAENKTDTPRFVPLNSQAKQILEKLKQNRKEEAEFVFPSSAECGHLREIRKTFKRLLESAKVQSYRLHDLRRQFATNLLNNGVSVWEIQKLLGHADVRSTQIYAKLASQTMRAASEKSAEIIADQIARAS